MKIIEVAREQRDLLNEGIAYIAVWQQATPNGRKSWFTEDFFPVDSKEEEPVFDSEQKERLAEIAGIDSDAVLLNGYYHAWIGSADEPLNATDISVGLKKHYEQHNALISGYIAEDEPAPAYEDLKMDEREELGLGHTHRDPVGEDGMQSSDVPDTITIEVPFTGNEEILRSLLQSKTTLITAALGEDGTGELPIDFEDGKAKFEWLRFGVDSEIVEAWSAFICAAVKFSKKAKRVTAKDKAIENEKFAFRTFMVKIGMNDVENKEWRRLLMKNLKGDAAFATMASRNKWLANHGPKKKGDSND